MAHETDNKEYKGPGQLTASVGRGVVEGITLSAIALGIAAAASKNVRGSLSFFSKPFKLMFRPSKAIQTVEETSKLIAKHGDGLISGTAVAGGSVLAGGVVGGLHGLYRGAANAGIAEQQVTSLNDAVDEQKLHVARLLKEREAAAAVTLNAPRK
jgi:hypothetical protein